MKKVDSRKVASLRGSEATEAIHKKVDSSMDRHADKSARDDGERARLASERKERE